MISKPDSRWLAAAACLAERARPLSRPNPAVGAIVVKDGIVVGRGWTQPGGRPHAEAVALQQAGSSAKGATLYVTLEPCAHQSGRGPACTDLVLRSGVARAVIGIEDPDERTSGLGLRRMRDAGVEAVLAYDAACRRSLDGYLTRKALGRPHVTLKMAVSIDGCIALESGESQWITCPESRSHAHRERARTDAILVGGGTLRSDEPRLDVRLPGLETRSPRKIALSSDGAPTGWWSITEPKGISTPEDVQYLLIEGGAGAAASFLEADLVDRLLVYRAPIVIGGGRGSVGDIGLGSLADAHGRWSHVESRKLGTDTLDIYQRNREAKGQTA